MREILHFLGEAARVIGKIYSHPAGRVAIQNLPRITREIDGWISTRSYDVAQAKVREYEQRDASKLKSIYEQRRAEMSPEVLKEFEARLRRRGELP